MTPYLPEARERGKDVPRIGGELRTVWLREVAYSLEDIRPATSGLFVEAAQLIDDLRQRVAALEKTVAERRPDATFFMARDEFNDETFNGGGGALVFSEERHAAQNASEGRTVALDVVWRP